MSEDPQQSDGLPNKERPRFANRTRRLLFGAPRDLGQSSLFHRISLIAVLAWVGLGADGLSSSAYGPEEAFRALHGHEYIALGLAALTMITITLIATAYSHIIEEFPSGGGGYVVATKLLGARAGVISGCALLVDYVLTIAVSVTAAGDSLFSLVPPEYQSLKLLLLSIVIVGLTILNIRGVRESVLVLAPIFFLFLITHALLICFGIGTHLTNVPEIFQQTTTGLSGDLRTLGIGGVLSILVYAYSLGGGTYTGIEAVSNGLPIMREPRVRTAKRTMLYMAVSLSLTAGGLLVCYLLWNVVPETGKTLNAVLATSVASHWPLGNIFVAMALISAGAILVVAAQTGFLDGPRVLANMAVDSWVPHRFSLLSERLTSMDGIVLMGVSALAVLLYTRADIHALIVMYSINVFLTFSLSMLGMSRLWWTRLGKQFWKRRLSLFSVGLILCATILIITMIEKFSQGGWLTLVITGVVAGLCFLIRAHYSDIGKRLQLLDQDFAELPIAEGDESITVSDASANTAAVLVGPYSGLGIHTILTVLRSFPNHYKNLVFLSVGIVDSGELKGAGQIEALREKLENSLKKYSRLAAVLGFPSHYRLALGTDVIDEATRLCREVAKDYSHVTFFAGKLVFKKESWYHKVLHNQTAFSMQRRLWLDGKTMVILPVRVK